MNANAERLHRIIVEWVTFFCIFFCFWKSLLKTKEIKLLEEKKKKNLIRKEEEPQNWFVIEIPVFKSFVNDSFL